MSLDVNISEPDEFNCFELHSCIESVAKIKAIENFTYHVDYACDKTENFIANVFRVTFKENDENKTSVIVKTLINTTRQELFRELHKREVKAYKEIIDKFRHIQSDIDDSDKIVLPECVFASTQKGNEVIILEDLLLNGFEIDSKMSKYEYLDYTQVSAVFKELAKFHALSFVYQRKDVETFSSVRAEFNDIMFKNSFLNKSKLRTYYTDSFDMSLKLITDLDAKKKLECVKTKLLDLLRAYVEPRKYNVFCHGDCWINNVLFKHEEADIKLCFVDYQAMRYASPVIDLLYFLYICTDSLFRHKYFNKIKSDYYDNFKSFLSLYNIDSNDIYPIDEFEKDIRDMLPFGLIIALIELRIMTTTPEDEAHMNISKGSIVMPELEDSKVIGEDTLLQIRVNDVVRESNNNGVLDRLYHEVCH